MKRSGLPLITLFIVTRIFGQDTVTYPDRFVSEDPVVTNYEANLDSLLNVYYVNQSLEEIIDDSQLENDTRIPEFPDSVYLARLSEIPSVVDLTYNRLVKNYIDVYSKKRRDQVKYMLGLTDYYFPFIEEIFDFYNVPYELKYLSIIESALNPRAVSRAGAVGIWQFMYGTGRYYGLNINSLVDERRDPVRSTHAAARYLADLYGMYGDWTLALAAYNCGPGNVNKAIRRSGGKKNFWDIYYYLPRETRGYVPAFIAATYTMNYYTEHNLYKIPVELPLYSDTLVIREPLHLRQVAGVLNIPVQLIRDMNPQYRNDIIPATEEIGYSIRLPIEYTASFIDLQDSIFAFMDSVYFDNGKTIATPQRVTASYQVDLPEDKYDKLYYVVKSGDNIGYIADWYDVRASDLRYWNNISRNLIRTGQRLVIYKPKGTSAKYSKMNEMTFAEKQKMAGREVAPAVVASRTLAIDDGSDDYVTYTVRSGDTLWDIARKFPGVSDSDIARLNNITNSSKINPGQVIKIKRKG
ncbi:MAG TPA: LysM peptidoglycan-binding domain-containing protein [Bacteroidaceae bacterium]|nr:LysM peptidoglycan-binding domain-containing protein [Bacteroidaceae bacterium]